MGGVIATSQPDLEVVTLFCSNNLAIRPGLMRGKQLLVAVIGADYIEQVGKSVIIVVADIWPEQRLRHRTSRIELVKDIYEPLQNLPGEVTVGRIADLITGAEQNDARVISVAAYDITCINPGPFVKVEMIIVWVLGDGPAVEHLVHHQQPDAVAQIKKVGRGRIVGGANSVNANLLQEDEAPLPGAQRNRSTKSTGVVMKADAFQLEVPAVEPEPACGVEVKLADTEISAV